MRTVKKTTGTERGLSLIELLIAMALSVGVIGIVISLFAASKRSYLIQDNVAWMQENARHAFRRLGYDIRMSGYLGELQEYWNLQQTAEAAKQVPALLTGECFTQATDGTVFRWVAPMLSSDGAALPSFGPKLYGTNNGQGDFQCLNAGTSVDDYAAGTDVLSVHYAEAGAVANGALMANRVYVDTSLQNGRLFDCDTAGAGCLPVDAPVGGLNHALYAGVYYVTPCGRAGPDNLCGTADDVPALMRIKLDTDGTITRDRMAEGVADLQLQYGLDTDADGLPDRYVDSDNGFRDKTNWLALSTVKTVRVWLLMRVREPGNNDANGDYVYADVTTTPAAGFRYEVFTSTFGLRNQYSASPM